MVCMDAQPQPGASASVRVSLAALVGGCAGLLASLPGNWQIGTLAGWDAAAVVYLAWTWTTIWRRDAAATARLAVREDPGRATSDALLLVASVASLLAVVLVISAGSTKGAGARDARAALAVATAAILSVTEHRPVELSEVGPV